MSEDAAPAAEPAPITTPVEAEKTSPLTDKFTDAEWTALKEFRTALPLIFTEAFSSLKPGKELEPVTIWGVTVDPEKGGIDDPRISVILVKFLRARNLNVTEATTMFTNTLRWRHEFKAEETIKETFPEDVFGKVGYVFGKDKEGHPITYNVYGGNNDLPKVFEDVPLFLRWRVALMEKGLLQVDFLTVDSLVQVHDYDGVSMSSRDANSKRAANEASTLFQDHYPELLHKKFFVNVPALMAWIFWAVRPIMPAKTFAKLQMVGRGTDVIGKEMLPIIDASELPKRYGGEAEAF